VVNWSFFAAVFTIAFGMNKLLISLVFALGAWGCQSPVPSLSGTPADRENLKKTTAAIRDAFAAET